MTESTEKRKYNYDSIPEQINISNKIIACVKEEFISNNPISEFSYSKDKITSIVDRIKGNCYQVFKQYNGIKTNDFCKIAYYSTKCILNISKSEEDLFRKKLGEELVKLAKNKWGVREAVKANTESGKSKKTFLKRINREKQEIKEEKTNPINKEEKTNPINKEEKTNSINKEEKTNPIKTFGSKAQIEKPNKLGLMKEDYSVSIADKQKKDENYWQNKRKNEATNNKGCGVVRSN